MSDTIEIKKDQQAQMLHDLEKLYQKYKGKSREETFQDFVHRSPDTHDQKLAEVITQLDHGMNLIDPGTTAIGGALRYNADKIQWSLVDFPSLEPFVKVLMYGAKKYAPDNWKKGQDPKSQMESLLRHAFAFMSGENNDPESGESHLGHIICNAMFMIYNQKHHPNLDNR